MELWCWFAILVVIIIILAFVIYFLYTSHNEYEQHLRDKHKYEINEKERQIAEKNKQISVLSEHSQTVRQLKESITSAENTIKSEQYKCNLLQKQIEDLKQNHSDERAAILQKLNKLTDADKHMVTSELYDILLYYSLLNKKLLNEESPSDAKIAKDTFKYAIECKYKLEYILYLFPDLGFLFFDKCSNDDFSCYIKDPEGRKKSLFKTVDILNKDYLSASTIIELQNRVDFLEASQSNLTAIPYMSKIIADYETYGLEQLAQGLDWGNSQERIKKIKSIREIRKDAQAMVEKYKSSEYQLAYLLNLFPNLEDIIETDFRQLPPIEVSALSEYDSTRDWLSKEEFNSLSTTERNQLALDRYKQSKNKSKWQIGRDYELYIGYKYSQIGFDVDYYGSYKGLEDLGRDLIAKKNNKTVIIQCKYWSQKKLIHEKHIMQLYGTAISYCIENSLPSDNVSKVLITNIQLSPTAKKYANYLGVQYKENVPLSDYPCIKCNIGHDEFGNLEKIYHLPFDQKYDVTKIDKPGEFFATTVKEAENAGFRRAFKWFNS